MAPGLCIINTFLASIVTMVEVRKETKAADLLALEKLFLKENGLGTISEAENDLNLATDWEDAVLKRIVKST